MNRRAFLALVSISPFVRPPASQPPVPRRYLMARIRISGEELAAARDRQPGQLICECAAAEYRAIADDMLRRPTL